MAGTSLEAVRTNMSGQFARMTAAQRTTLGATFLAVVVALYVVSRVAGQTPMQTLYADLEPSAAAAIVDELMAQGVPYEIADNGRVVRVPVNRVHELRLDLSTQGLPDAAAGGWSILDEQGITTSEFDQRVGFQRALEGELARTIGIIEGVDSADVHLVIPTDDLFVGDDVAASASVLLETRGSTLSSTQVQAVVNLVSSSVEGLTPERVSVTDQTGRILAAPGDSPAGGGVDGESQLASTSAFESGLERDIEALIAAIAGPGRSVVTVNARLDFDTVSKVTEEYIPAENEDGDQMVVSETTRLETYQTEDGELTTGVLGAEVAANEGEVAAAAEDLRYRLDERDANYAMNTVVTSAEQAPGEIESISVAVLVDGNVIDDVGMAEIESLVAAAAGIDPERGDAIAVSAMAFDEQLVETLEAEAALGDEVATGPGLDIIGLARIGVTALVALAVLLIGLRMVRKGSKREVLESIDLAALPGGAAGLPAGDTEEATRDLQADEQLTELLSNQPDDVATVLRSWLADSSGERGSDDRREVSA